MTDPAAPSSPDPSDFGRRLRFARLKRGLSQSELAGDRFSASYISRLESGSRPPTEAVLNELARILEIPVGVLSGAGFDAALSGSAAFVAKALRLIGSTASADRTRARECLQLSAAYRADMRSGEAWLYAYMAARISLSLGDAEDAGSAISRLDADARASQNAFEIRTAGVTAAWALLTDDIAGALARAAALLSSPASELPADVHAEAELTRIRCLSRSGRASAALEACEQVQPLIEQEFDQDFRCADFVDALLAEHSRLLGELGRHGEAAEVLRVHRARLGRTTTLDRWCRLALTLASTLVSAGSTADLDAAWDVAASVCAVAASPDLASACTLATILQTRCELARGRPDRALEVLRGAPKPLGVELQAAYASCLASVHLARGDHAAAAAALEDAVILQSTVEFSNPA